MSREVRRIAKGFDWPLREIWSGYLRPDFLDEDSCPDCEVGYSPEADRFYKEWYGRVPFDPASMGSTPFLPTGEEARRWALRQTQHAPEYYGTGEAAIEKEAIRITKLWNGSWSHHLSQEDVAALVEADRLWDFTKEFIPGQGWKDLPNAVMPTAAEVNSWSLFGLGHDSVNSGVCIKARCEREGVPEVCATCKGHASVEKFKGQRQASENWKPTEPPSGTAWQLWETVSEGSPVTPAFETPEELAKHISSNPSIMGPGGSSMNYTAALDWVKNTGWAPSGVFILNP